MADKKISQLTSASTPLTGSEELAIVQSGSTVKATAQDVADLAGGGIGGTNYIYVMADGTNIENGDELVAAYLIASTMSPSPTNRITIVCGPGYYDLTNSGGGFTIDQEWVDVVSLDGNRSVVFTSIDGFGNAVSVLANDVFIKGFDTGTFVFQTINSQNLLRVENCKGAQGSFGNFMVDTQGTFIDCEAGFDSFGGTASGTFINCIGSDSSFGYGNATGIFINCQGGSTSFGSSFGIASGIFTNCVAGDYSFGATASGTFNNCTALANSFGATASGTFNNCTAGFDSFGAYSASGTFINCIGSDSSFGAYSASGTFNNCVGGNSSFGDAIASGIFTNCQGADYSFGGSTASGIFTNCQAALTSFGGSDASGTFTNCIGGNDSFGYGTLSGKLYYCRIFGFGTFNTVSAGGRTFYCVDGFDVPNNQ